MYELYNRSIVHCDLKPGNILVSPKGHLAIADFGISMIADEALTLTHLSKNASSFRTAGRTRTKPPSCSSPTMRRPLRVRPICGRSVLSSSRCTPTECVPLATCYPQSSMLKHQLFQRLFSSDALDVRNEVWAWDIPAIVRSEIGDELAQDLVIAVCGSSPHVSMVATHPTLFLLRF